MYKLCSSHVAWNWHMFFALSKIDVSLYSRFTDLYTVFSNLNCGCFQVTFVHINF